MKIVLFRDGRPGVVAQLPGEDPIGELAKLLGGETEMTEINTRLRLVTVKNSEKLPVRYAAHGLEEEPKQIAGDCAVVAVRPEGVFRDVTTLEFTAAKACIQLLG